MSDPASAAATVLPSMPGGASTSEIEVRKSRFITTIEPARSLDEANQVIAAVRRRLWDARHHCTAMIIGENQEIQRSSDDGEPAGTAGIPMLETLRAHAITNVVAVVTRYFGGTLLGTGGLIRAYSSAVRGGLAATPLLRQRLLTPCVVTVDHASAGRIEHALRGWCATHDAVLDDVGYGDLVVFRLLVPPTDVDGFFADVAAATSGVVIPVAEPPIVVATPDRGANIRE